MILEDIRLSTENALTRTFPPGSEMPPLILAVPPSHVNADFSIPWAMSAAKKFKKPPKELAEEIIRILKTDPLVACAGFTAPGFVNIRLSDQALIQNLAAVNSGPGFAKLSPAPD